MRLKRMAGGVLAGLVLLLAGTAARADWRWIGPSPESTNLNAVAFGNGLFVAVGDAGIILTSADGREWTQRSSWSNGSLEGVVYGAGGFVAVGGSDFRRSPDGVHWSVVPEIGHRFWADTVAYGDGQYLACQGSSLDAAGFVSTDGLTWQRLYPFPVRASGQVDTGRGLYRLVNRNQLVPDVGETPAAGASTTPEPIQGLAFGGGRYVRLWLDWPDYQGEPVLRIRYSGDATTWSAPEIDLPVAMDSRVTYVGSRFFVLSEADLTLTSTGGLTWGKVSLPASFQLRGVAYGNGQYVAVGDAGSIARSTDGLQWETVQGGITWGAIYGVAEGNGTRVAVGEQVRRSRDGGPWEVVALAHAGALRAVTYGNGQFVAVGEEGETFTSPDGLQWAMQPRYAISTLQDVIYTGRQYVAIGDVGQLYTSPDGKKWTKRATGVSNTLVRLAYGQGVLVAVGFRGSMLRSTDDGQTWGAVPQPENLWFLGVAYGNNRFVASGRRDEGMDALINTVTLTSADGLTWHPVASDLAPQGRVAFGNGQFLVGPSLGWVMLSADGEQWRAYRDPHFVGFFDTDYLRGEFYLSGSGLAVGNVGAPCPFPDLGPNSGICPAVAELQARGVLAGFPDGTFRPEQAVTRAEVAKLLVGLAGAEPDPGAGLAFTDTGGHWAAGQGYLQAAVKLELLTGFPDGSFRPDQPVTRGQLAKLVAAAAGASYGPDPVPYTDITAADWFRRPAAVAVYERLIGPAAAVPLWSGATFDGNRAATRGEVAAALFNWLAIRDYGY